MHPTSSEQPRFAAAVSTQSDTLTAACEVAQAALAQLRASDPQAVAHLALVFVSPDHAERMADLMGALHEALPEAILLGSTGESIVATGQELEQTPAVSLWLANLGGVSLVPLRMRYQRGAEGGSFVLDDAESLAACPPDSTVILLGEPFSFPADVLLQRWWEDGRNWPVVGAMASGFHSPGENRIALGSSVYTEGAVGVVLHGPIQIRTVVSQGCRPIGRPLVVTKAERNVIQQLGGKPALAQLGELYEQLAPQDQMLVQQGLHVGQVIDEYRDSFGRGDFLVRNCVGADRQSGSIAIGDYVRTGQTVQFHVRDAQSATDDLRELLAAAQAQQPATLGALLFTCNGRGTRLFDTPHHDAQLLSQVVGVVPTAGFFAQGELGPVGGRNFMHGFTASIALFGSDGS